MAAFLEVAFTFPTLFFTVPLIIVLLYWLMVIVGAVDIDMFDIGGDADGLLEGAAEGVADGALEGVAEGAVDGALEGAAEGTADGAAEAADALDGVDGSDGADAADHTTGGLAALLSYLGLRAVPLTLVISLTVFFGWVVTLTTARGLSLPAAGGLARWGVGLLVVLGALLVGLILTSFLARPLGKLFVVEQAPRRSTLVGRTCTITTGKVSRTFGQANYDDGGAGMVIQVRCERDDAFSRGDQALIVGYDAQDEAYTVEQYEQVLGGGE